MTETVDAIGYRADVKTRAKNAIADRKDAVVDRATNVVNRVVGAMPDVPSPTDMSMPGFVPDGDQVRHGAHQAKQGAKQAVSVAQSNPIGLGIGAIAAGFLVGMLVPSTPAEDRRFGDLADQVKDQARDLGTETLERTREVAQEAARSASQTMQESGQRHGEQLAEHLRQSAEEIGSSGA